MMSHYIFLIPLFPLLGFLFNFIVGVRVLTPRPQRKPAPAGGHGHDAHAHVHTPEPAHEPEAADDHAHKVQSPAHPDDDHGAHPAPSPIVGIVACLMVALSFVFAVLVVYSAHSGVKHDMVATAAQEPGAHVLTQKLWDWIPGGAAETAVHGHAGTSPF